MSRLSIKTEIAHLANIHLHSLPQTGAGDSQKRRDETMRHAGPHRSWTTGEARLVLNWARSPVEQRLRIDVIASRIDRSTGAVQEFLRRALPRGQRPWTEKPRWAREEIEALQNDQAKLVQRSKAAIKKYEERHCSRDLEKEHKEEELEQQALSIKQVAADLGISRASIYRLIKKGILRRYRGGIAETAFSTLLREHPEIVPYSKLPIYQKEWLVLNGYFDPSLQVKPPTTKNILD
jgi:transposase